MSVIEAIIISGIRFVITSSNPIPFKNIPLVSTIKNLTGFSQVIYCRKTGISSIGEIKPDKSTAGIINVITLKMACCWVLHTAEIYSPTPTIASRDIKIETINKINDPANGIWKKIITKPVITIVNAIAMIKGGMDFPKRISKEDK